jgi:type IV pilus assembly protein PilA
MLRGKRSSSGFTLLELIIVVIVIGILASIALPRYLQVAEKGRIAEAKATLGALRAAQLRYAAAKGHFTDVFSELDYTTTATKYFSYNTANTTTTVAAADLDTTPVAQVQRNTIDTISSCGAAYVVTITQGGALATTDVGANKLL